MLSFDLKELDNLIKKYILKELYDVNYVIEYIKIKNRKDMENESEFRNKFDLLYNYYSDKITSVKQKKMLKFFYDKITEKFGNKNIIMSKKIIENNDELLELIMKDFTIVKEIKNMNNSWDNSIYIVKSKNNSKKYFLKIYYEKGLYMYNSSSLKYILNHIDNFFRSCNLINKASKESLTPEIYKNYLYLYQKKSENKKDNYSCYRNILITDYVEGVNLDDYFKTQKFTEKDLDTIKELMKKLHNIGIFHGDIRSSNIIYNKNYKNIKDKFKFVDFTYSKTCESISSNSLQKNLTSLDNMVLNYKNKDEILAYIAIYYLIKEKKIKITL
jgi:hypothetical protein